MIKETSRRSFKLLLAISSEPALLLDVKELCKINMSKAPVWCVFLSSPAESAAVGSRVPLGLHRTLFTKLPSALTKTQSC